MHFEFLTDAFMALSSATLVNSVSRSAAYGFILAPKHFLTYPSWYCMGGQIVSHTVTLTTFGIISRSEWLPPQLPLIAEVCSGMASHVILTPFELARRLKSTSPLRNASQYGIQGLYRGFFVGFPGHVFLRSVQLCVWSRETTPMALIASSFAMALSSPFFLIHETVMVDVEKHMHKGATDWKRVIGHIYRTKGAKGFFEGVPRHARQGMLLSCTCALFFSVKRNL